MNVAIIGAGNVGSALAGAITRAGHEVTISATDPAHAQRAALQTGARAASSSRAAVDGATIVVLAVPIAALPDVATELKPALRGKVVVDVANRPTPVPGTPDGPSIAEELQALLPESRVVKAFNTVFASRQARPDLDGTPIDGYVAGDDAAAKSLVLELVESIGMQPYDVGGLAVAQTLEGMAWLHIQLAMQHGWSWQSGWKLVGPTETAVAA
jgi:predicted dinucleotide-binding enzyme